MKYRQEKKYKETVDGHDGRIEYLEKSNHNKELRWWLTWCTIGLLMLLLGGFYDLIAPFLIKTRYFSFSYSPEIGLAQGLLMGAGALLLIISACMYDYEIRNYKN